MAITATEKKQLKKEIVAELKAEASDVLQLEEVTSLAGVRSFPAVRGENPVSVPLSLLDFSPAIDKKVDKVAGKGLSTEDFTTAEKQKLAGIAAGANNYTHPTSHPASRLIQRKRHGPARPRRPLLRKQPTVCCRRLTRRSWMASRPGRTTTPTQPAIPHR